MPDLATFQRNFAAALLADDEPSPSFPAQAFAVYRNTSARGAVEALRAAYPTVNMLLGEAMFTEVALDYRRHHRPHGPVLTDYGAGFAGFLSRQPWTGELPYLADVARLDRLWLEAFIAADPHEPEWCVRPGSTIALLPATRFGWFATPAMTIWQAHREPSGLAELEPDWTEEGALFTRSGLGIRAELIDAPFHHFLIACSTPSTATDVAAALGAAFPGASFAELLERGVVTGAVTIQ
jgi:hypothetical protein